MALDNSPITVRRLGPADTVHWVSMRVGLFPNASHADHEREIAAILASRNQVAFAALSGTDWLGFIELRQRDYAEGCDTSPVGYIEALWVAPPVRREGVARRLVDAAITWATARGYRELASDTPIENTPSRLVHEKLGFTEAERLVCFKLNLGG